MLRNKWRRRECPGHEIGGGGGEMPWMWPMSWPEHLWKSSYFMSHPNVTIVLPWWLSGKESTYQCRRRGFDPWVGKMPWRRKWQPTPVFLPGKSHGQRSTVGYSPQCCKKLQLNSSITIRLQNILASLLPDPLCCQTNHQLCCGHSAKGVSPLCFGFSNSSQGPGQMTHEGAVCHHPKTPLCLK